MTKALIFLGLVFLIPNDSFADTFLWEWNETEFNIHPSEAIVLTTTFYNLSPPGFDEEEVWILEALLPPIFSNDNSLGYSDFDVVPGPYTLISGTELDPYLGGGESLEFVWATLTPKNPLEPGTYSILPFVDLNIASTLSLQGSYRLFGPIEITVLPPVPVPGAIILFASALIGLAGMGTRKS